MQLHVTALMLVFLALAVVPAWADYNNGPIYGAVDAWPIAFGFTTSDSFLADNSTVTGFMFGVWEYPNDMLTSVDWSITSAENGGTVYGSGTAKGGNLTQQFLSTNAYGFDIDKITVQGLDVAVTSGSTYWLNLEDASVPSGDPVYWDENSGMGCSSPGCPSKASVLSVGTVPSESFTVNTGGGGGTTPEPGSFVLFGSGILGLAGVLRRKRL